MTGDKIRCGGLIVRKDLFLVEVLGYVWRPGGSCGILAKFADAGVSLGFLNISKELHGRNSMVFCLPSEARSRCSLIFDEVRAEFAPAKVEVRDHVSILTLYGPHFYERVGLSSEFYSVLCRARIDALAIGSSVNSISVVLTRSDAERTREAMRERFDWPE